MKFACKMPSKKLIMSMSAYLESGTKAGLPERNVLAVGVGPFHNDGRSHMPGSDLSNAHQDFPPKKNRKCTQWTYTRRYEEVLIHLPE